MAAADGDGGVVVRMVSARSCLIAGILTVGACVTTTTKDDIRDGQRLVETTGEAIAADPEAWDGKWVRIAGVLSTRRQILYTNEHAAAFTEDERMTPGGYDGSLYLDPANFDLQDEETFERDAPGGPALVSGRVRIDCWAFWLPHFKLAEENAARDIVSFAHPRPPENAAYCNATSAPYLERAVIEPLPGDAQ